MDETDEILQKNFLTTREKISSVKSASFFTTGQERIFLLSFTEKIILLFDELWSDSASLHSCISSLRFILEALVKTERFLKDEKYLETFYYQYIFDHKSRLVKLKNRLEKEIKLLDKYINKENKILASASTLKEYDEAEKTIMYLYEELESEFSIYIINPKIHGFNYLKFQLETKQLPILIESISNLEDEIKASKISEDGKYIRIKDEFKEYKLEEEYDFTYSYTSDLIHCRSYSINTPLEIDKIEKQMFKRMALNFVSKIANNLLKLGNIPNDIKFLDLSENYEPSKIKYKTSADDTQISKWSKEFSWSIDKIIFTLGMKASPSLKHVFFKNSNKGIPTRYISYQSYESFNFELINTKNKDDVISFKTIEELISCGWILD